MYTQESVQAILDGMAWLGLNYDEGPYYQTKHFSSNYSKEVDELIIAGRCIPLLLFKRTFRKKITQEQTASKEKPRYDGFCRERTSKGKGLIASDFKIHSMVWWNLMI